MRRLVLAAILLAVSGALHPCFAAQAPPMKSRGRAASSSCRSRT